MDQDIQQGTQSEENKLVPVVLYSIVAALVVGGGVYAYQKSQNDTAQKDLQSQINNLRVKVADARTVMVSAIPNPTSTTSTLKTYTSRNTQLTFQYSQAWFVREDTTIHRTYLSNYAGVFDIATFPSDYEQIWLSTNPIDTDSVQGSEGVNSSKFQVAKNATSTTDQIIAGDKVIGSVTQTKIGHADVYTFTTVGGSALVAYGSLGHGFNYGASVSTELGAPNQSGEVSVLEQVLATATSSR